MQVIYAVSKRHQNFIIQELLMTFQNNEEAEEKYFTFPLIHVLIFTWCFCFVFVFCMFPKTDLVYHRKGKKPEGRAVSLSSLTKKSLNSYDPLDGHTHGTM